MKKVIKPAALEQSERYCDFSGEKLEYESCSLKIDFGYGSKYDGATLELDLSESAEELLIMFIKANLNPKSINNLKKDKKKLGKCYNDVFDARDWESTEYMQNGIDLLEELIK